MGKTRMINRNAKTTMFKENVLKEFPVISDIAALRLGIEKVTKVRYCKIFRNLS